MLVGAAVGAVVIGGGIVIYNNREAVGDAIEKSMEMRGEAELLNAQSQMKFREIPMVLFPACSGNDDSSKRESEMSGEGFSYGMKRRTVWAVAVQEVREVGTR
ncbi:hypothetical protein ACLB1T_18440 [Escherichia coli]